MTGTTTLKFKRTVIQDQTLEVPNYFTQDPTVRGVLVNKLLRQEGHHCDFNGEPEMRYDLFGDDAKKIDMAIQYLTVFYTKADEILDLLGVDPNGELPERAD